MLSTTKEVEDAAAGKETRDMTRAQIVKSIFRILSLKLGRANIPLIVTNHTYDVVGAYMPTKEMGGGSGLKYAASTIIYLSKSKDKVRITMAQENSVQENSYECKDCGTSANVVNEGGCLTCRECGWSNKCNLYDT